MKYPSRFSPGKMISANQYITELICENSARKEHGGELPIHFWRQTKWSKFFGRQIIRVSQLLKKYHSDAVIRIVKQKRIWNIYPKWIEEEISKINEECIQAAEKRTQSREVVDRKAKNSAGAPKKVDKLWEMLD